MSLHLAPGAEPIVGYTLVRMLGRGGFGEVWEANAPGGVHVALKFIRLESYAAAVEQRALAIIRNIRHPHLLDVQFAAQVEDKLVIAMPLCDRNLIDRLRACPGGLPLKELLGYMVDLARAVDFLNEPRHRGENGVLVGVQHRDIKPHNMFLVGGSVRLADFGIAKILAASSGSHTGIMSVKYVAPEVFKGRISRHADQYSLAISYVQLRTGRLPFGGASDVQFMHAHLEEDPDLSGLPEAERPAITRALAKQPEERWPSCKAFVRALVSAPSKDEGRQVLSCESTGVPDAHAVPVTQGPSTLHETQLPPSFPHIVIGEEGLSGVGAEKRAALRRKLRLFGLAIVLSALFVTPIFLAMMRSPRTTSPAPPTEPAPLMPETETAPERETTRPGSPEPTDPKIVTNTIGMKLVLIPAGEFGMGSPDWEEDGLADEKPQHRVRITRPFYLGIHEVTQGQYEEVIGENPSAFKGSNDLPVERVSWNDAIAFCNRLSEREGMRRFYPFVEAAQSGGDGYRLPTEAEWEYACRAGSRTKFNFADDKARLVDYAWFKDNSSEMTHPVGLKRPNAFGLHDMHGNVHEW